VRGWYANRPLRSRLALLTALAVALGVAVCAVVVWVLVRDQLRQSLDERLAGTAINHARVEELLRAGDCATQPAEGTESAGPAEPGGVPGVIEGAVQVVDAGGRTCLIEGDAALRVADADRAVAAGRSPEALHDTTGSDGAGYRVITRPLAGPPGVERGLAVSVARPLSEVDATLRALTWVLLITGAAGTTGAAAVGAVLARAGLRPVDRLTQAAEHIARTEDLSVRIPVTGDDEVARLSRSFNSMTAALASSRELQQQLIADAGHELRTPLTSLRTNIELLVRSEETGRPLPARDRRELMESVTAQLGELAALIGDLQELSRPEAAAGSGRPGPAGLHDTVARAVARARPRARGLPIVAELEPWYVRADPTALERAVVNLLDNAVKFGGAGTRGADGAREAAGVEVVLRNGVLSIRDHGPGIPPEDLPHVFERFWRSPGARGLPGSGLGLSIVARTVRECGGDIRLRPAPGGGTEALLTLPGGSVPPGTAG
jgi:two-component system sensor histidine kinase MprB